ncbi:hypothetical protein NGM37_28170, partial [Streptomyces sp. TRM76130]|nr:hypothetical protein [Streptomyces sp. TRM76130]
TAGDAGDTPDGDSRARKAAASWVRPAGPADGPTDADAAGNTGAGNSADGGKGAQEAPEGPGGAREALRAPQGAGDRSGAGSGASEGAQRR